MLRTENFCIKAPKMVQLTMNIFLIWIWLYHYLWRFYQSTYFTECHRAISWKYLHGRNLINWSFKDGIEKQTNVSLHSQPRISKNRKQWRSLKGVQINYNPRIPIPRFSLVLQFSLLRIGDLSKPHIQSVSQIWTT